MAFQQEPLPYDPGALEPHGMSAKTFEFHYGKHHAAYVANLNKLTQDTELADKSLEEVIRLTFEPSKMNIFNNAAQTWNHTFFWNSMKPNGGGAPTGAIAAKIDSDLGGYDKFKEEFKNAAATQFGSGWAWLVLDNGTLKVTKTPNAENPLVHNQVPLLTLDVWEHAYYLDYQNRRPDFIQNYLDQLVNWDFANQNLAAA
ncbi:MAG: superoxide dismutase [Synechococcales cyanobacterium C42_A2020_086]|jgi:Fe-Mn family superoxide dismutase|nr:superoxide dismutase [Synechococcales cyanobacterium M58_A2018_015]MBF2076128.1 superoxide dismutase [Synechococcales cyanobacterium C42_A2020_086]